MLEPLAVGMHAVHRIPVMAGDNDVFLGGGTIALSALQSANAVGAKKVIVVKSNFQVKSSDSSGTAAFLVFLAAAAGAGIIAANFCPGSQAVHTGCIGLL